MKLASKPKILPAGLTGLEHTISDVDPPNPLVCLQVEGRTEETIEEADGKEDILSGALAYRKL